MLDDADRSRIAAELQRRLEARPEIVFAYLHGSFVSGGAYRDVDVAVWVDPAREPDHGTRYALDLALELEQGLAARLDVQVLNDAPLAFRYHALDGRLLFTRDEEFLDELRARTWGEYFDFAPLARQYLRDALGE